tara:strand:+ start:1179 stop:6338 length:5160 start_codon:yes stop_codon:yes gene_type:complete
MAVTREDIIKNDKFMETLADYGFRRNGDMYNSQEEAVDSFLEDYRAVQANTISTVKFMNFVDNIDDNNKEDAQFKKDLGELYKVVDQDVDEVFGDSTLGEKADAIYDYTKYALIDPINLLGGVVGKAIGATAGRTAIKGLMNNVFKSKIAKGAAGAAAIEAPIAAGQETLLQMTEKDLDVRKEVDLGEVATASAIGGVTGGVFGGVGAKLAGGDKVAEIKRVAAENLEDTVQGRGAKRNSLEEAFDNFDQDLNTSKVDVDKVATIDDFDGSYVLTNKNVIVEEDYYPLGKITSIDKNNKTAEIEFLPKGDDEAGSIKKTVEFKDVKLTSEKQTNELVSTYVSKYNKFYDKSDPDFENTKQILKDGGLFTDVEADEVFGSMLNPESIKDLNDAILSLGAGNPIIKNKHNRMKRVTENFSNLIEEIDPDPSTAAGKVIDAFIKKGIPLEKIQMYYKADISLALAKGGNQSALQKAKDAGFLQVLQEAEAKITPEQRQLLKLVSDQKEAEKKLAGRFNVAVDVWRSFLVTQPATTMRNIIGSAARVPGQTVEGQLDNLLIKTDRNILGFEEEVGRDVLTRNILDLTTNMLNPEDSIPLVRMIGEKIPEVDRKILKEFDDHISVDLEEGKNAWDKTIKGLSKASKVANLLNRQQDMTIKSASFLSEIDWLIKQDINRGRITTPGIDGIDSMIKNNKLELLNDEMVSKALDFAYKMTYQTKRAGDDLIFGGNMMNNFQSWLNSSPAIKLAIPFPNFLINSLVYTTNRMGLGAVKFGIGGADVIKRSLSKGTNRKNRIDLETKTKQLEDMVTSKDPVNQTAMKKLQGEIDDLDRYFGKAQKSLINLKKGFTETTEGLALMTMALTLRLNAGGSEWYLIKDPTGQERDMRPLFPFAPFLFFADLIIRANKTPLTDEKMPISEDYLKNGAEAVLGVSARSGAIGNLMRNGYTRLQTSSENPLDARDLGKTFGSLVGYMLGGIATPLRPISDLAQTLSGPKRLERGMQKNAFGVDIEVDWPITQGFIDQAAKDIFRGTPFEEGFEASVPGTDISVEVPGAFKDTPEFASATATKTPDAPLAPIEKQLTGATVVPKKTVVGEELAKAGIPEYKLAEYTKTPEYNYLYKKTLGMLTTELVEPYLNSDQYLKFSPEEKANALRLIYFGKTTNNLDARTKQGLLARGSIPANIRRRTSEEIKKEYPILNKLKNFGKTITKDITAKAIKQYKNENSVVGGISLNYIDEKKNPVGAKKLEEMIDAITEIADKLGSAPGPLLFDQTRRARDKNLAKGGYISQMNALGFDEGGYVGGDEYGVAPKGSLIASASTEVPVSDTDSKSVTEEEVKNLANTLTQIGVDMSPAGTYEAIKNLPQNVKDSVSEYDKGNVGKAALLMVLGTAGAIPGMPSNVIGKAVKGKPVKGKVISADEVVADDTTKMYAKSIEDADRLDNVKDWQTEVELVMKERKIDPSVRTPELEVSAKKLVNKEISREEHLRSIDKHKPVRSFDELPRQPTDKAVVFALKNNQRAEGLFQLPEEVTKKLNVKRSPLKVGDPIQGRLDIPAYTSHDTWVVTLLSSLIKNAKGNRTSIYAKAIHYAPDSKKGYVEFKAAEGLGQKIATGQQGKTPYATVVGAVKDLDPERIRKKASELLNDPEWVQVSFDPRRQTSFYIRKGADGLPVHTPIASADEVIQIGPLVLAKNAVAKTKKDGTPWNDLNRGGSINRQMVALGL